MQNELREKIQEEAIKELLKHNRRTAAISMRVGKTLIGIKVAEEKCKQVFTDTKVYPKVLVVAPKLSIFDGWKEDLDKFNFQHLHKFIDYCTYVSFAKKDLSGYDLIIFDEAHSLKISHVGKGKKMSDHGLKLGQYQGDILGLTGTPPTDTYTERARMIDAYCPVVYTYETEDAIVDEILNDYRIIVHMIPLSLEKNIHVKTGKWDFMTNERGTYNSLTKKLEDSIESRSKQWAALTRMKQMQSFKSKEDYAKKLMTEIEDKCLVFTNTKEQADALCSHSYHSGNSKLTNETNLQLFKSGVIEEMTCVNQISEGQTIPGLKASIIMHAYGNEIKFSQRFARCLSLTTDDMSNIHLLCYKDTVDEDWIRRALSALDQDKIKYLNV